MGPGPAVAGEGQGWVVQALQGLWAAQAQPAYVKGGAQTTPRPARPNLLTALILTLLSYHLVPLLFVLSRP